MNFIKHIERINKIHQLISTEKTGTPDNFAQTLHLSRRQLYNELETLKNLDASIKYCKKKESFYYDEPFELVFKYSLTTIVSEQTREIFGGSDFRAINLHGSILNFSDKNEVLKKHFL